MWTLRGCGWHLSTSNLCNARPSTRSSTRPAAVADVSWIQRGEGIFPPRLADMERRYPEYMPLRFGKPPRRRGILRTAKLNMVGGAAVVGTCLAAAGLGFVAGRLLGLPVAVTASAGGLLPLALLTTVDRHRWKSMLASYGWGGTTAEVSAVAAELLRRGVVTNVEVHDDVSTSLRYRKADADVVLTVLAEHGVPIDDDPWLAARLGRSRRRRR